jgi:hypothetical protein
MRGKMIGLALFAAASVALLPTSSAWASAPATPGSVSTPLAFQSFGTIVVDDTNRHVFVSSPSANEVQVYDFDGALVTTISNLGGASGMVIHGSDLYVAESEDGDIDAIGLTGLTDQGHVATGLTDPDSLASRPATRAWCRGFAQRLQPQKLISSRASATGSSYATRNPAPGIVRIWAPGITSSASCAHSSGAAGSSSAHSNNTGRLRVG